MKGQHMKVTKAVSGKSDKKQQKGRKAANIDPGLGDYNGHPMFETDINEEFCFKFGLSKAEIVLKIAESPKWLRMLKNFVNSKGKSV